MFGEVAEGPFSSLLDSFSLPFGSLFGHFWRRSSLKAHQDDIEGLHGKQSVAGGGPVANSTFPARSGTTMLNTSGHQNGVEKADSGSTGPGKVDGPGAPGLQPRPSGTSIKHKRIIIRGVYIIP